MRGDYKYLLVYVALSAVSLPYCLYLSDIASQVALYLIVPLIIVARFLAGFGLLGTLFVGVTYLFKYIPKNYRKSKHAAFIVKIVVLFVLAVCILLPLKEIASIILDRVSINFINLLIGIYSFVFTMYIVPVWKAEKGIFDEGLFSRVMKKFDALKRKIKKAYYRYFSRDLLKAYSVDFLYLKARLDEFKLRTAWRLLPALVLLMISVPPAAIIIVIASWRILKRKYTIMDKLFFVGTILLTTTYVIHLMTSITIAPLAWSLPYAIGALICLAMFMDALIDMLK